MINFYDGQIADILPGNLMDTPEAQAFSLALREGTRLLHKYTQLCYVYCSIDTAQDPVLDLLARELRTQYYSDSLDIDTKRSLVRNTLIWYMTAGTPAAVEELVAVVFGEGEVTEWYEYGGEPYWFKIRTNALLTEDMTTYFSEMIRRVKNTRSHIEAIEVHRTLEQTIYAGCCLSPQYKPAAIIDGYNVDRTAEQTIYAGAGGYPSYKPAAIIDGYKEDSTVQGITYASTGEASRTHQAPITEALEFEGEEIHAKALKAGTAATGTTRQAAILEGFTESGEEVTEAIYAGTAISSKYTKSTITEGGNENATAI